jgi:hypothetical protein
MSEHDGLHERGRALEEEYFRRKDRELIAKLRHAAEEKAARAEMGRATGLSDPTLLRELQELGFTPATVSLLPFVPLLEIAWAEGGVHPAERDLIEDLARSRGIDPESRAGRQLSQWMDRRPAPIVFERAGRLIAALLESTSGNVRRGLTAGDLVEYCQRLAHVSGGIFGTWLRSVTPEERVLLTRIANELASRHGGAATM